MQRRGKGEVSDGKRIAMDEVKVTVPFQSREQWVIRHWRDAAPAHVRHRQTWSCAQLVCSRGENAQAFCSVFLRPLRKQVHPEANPEDRLGQLGNHLCQAGPLEPLHAIGRGADARQDDMGCSADFGGVRRANAAGSQAVEGSGKRGEIRATAVDDCDRGVQLSVPLVEGMPSPSRRTACRRVLPAALKHASTM